MRCACSIRQVLQPLHLLVGNPGVLELIGDYVGVVRGREARIIRQLKEMLPLFAKYLANIRSMFFFHSSVNIARCIDVRLEHQLLWYFV